MKSSMLKTLLATAVCVVSCRSVPDRQIPEACQARYFELGDSCVVIISPKDGHRDTVDISAPYKRVVCMSSTHVACLSVIGHQSDIVGVNGLRYVSDTMLRRSDSVSETGDLDFEKVISLRPDLLVASGDGMTDYSRLNSFGIRVIHLYDYLEQHPLARAEYVRLFGALTGCKPAADSFYAAVNERYMRLTALASCAGERPDVLVNIPFGDSWYVPGNDGYFARLIRDAGADVAGARDGAESSVITVEKAFELSLASTFWLNPGWCRTLDELRSSHPLFQSFGALGVGRVFNNIRRASEAGGNDFYESGAVRPDLVLEDLVRIFHPELLPDEMKNVSPEDLHYYVELH